MSNIKDQNRIVLNISDNLLVKSALRVLSDFNNEFLRLNGEIESARSNYADMKRKFEDETSLALRLKEKLKNADDENRGLKETSQKQESKVEDLDSEVKDLKVKLKNADDENSGLKDASQKQESKVEDLKVKLKNADDENRGLKETSQKQESEVKELEGNINASRKALFDMVVQALKEIDILLPDSIDDTNWDRFLAKIKKRKSDSTNKGIGDFSQYETMGQIIRYLSLPDHALALIGNLVWWNNQPALHEILISKIKDIDKVAIIYLSRILIPFEIYGCKIHQPDGGFGEKEINFYVNTKEENKYFKELFEFKLPDSYLACEITELAYKDKLGSCSTYYSKN